MNYELLKKVEKGDVLIDDNTKTSVYVLSNDGERMDMLTLRFGFLHLVTLTHAELLTSPKNFHIATGKEWSDKALPELLMFLNPINEFLEANKDL